MSADRLRYLTKENRHLHLAKVAEIYLDAASKGRKTTSIIAAAYSVPSRTASNWVRECREAGLIDDAPATKSGAVGTNPKLIAVAKALNVTVEALSDAVRVHANGDLRVKF